MNKQWIFIFIIPLIMSGCGIFRKSDIHTTNGPVPDLTNPLSAAHQAAANFNYLSYNADIVLVTDGDENSVSANFRIKKDSLIWVSVRKLGFEAARLMLSKDSVWMMDRINSTYFSGNYLFFSRQFRLDADYNMIESFLLGNPLYDWSDEPMDVDCSRPHSCIIAFDQRQRIRSEQYTQEGSSVTFQILEVDRKNGRVLFQSVAIPEEGRKISATYDDFQNVTKTIIPAQNQVSIEFDERKDAVTITAESFKKDETLTFPFRIPSQYKPMEMKP